VGSTGRKSLPVQLLKIEKPARPVNEKGRRASDERLKIRLPRATDNPGFSPD
jgi:hypothetical protein